MAVTVMVMVMVMVDSWTAWRGCWSQGYLGWQGGRRRSRGTPRSFHYLLATIGGDRWDVGRLVRMYSINDDDEEEEEEEDEW